ncbi:unnamed protein product [Wuchereria bancrofti]|uniref:Uncharacterized protein n=1 Tax=Wuchereria bancrofti TaxID=6293 RepID=A0A3P7EG63_WUCBA|nr:unnamed protein product [Wuchereria bancrofti]
MDRGKERERERVKEKQEDKNKKKKVKEEEKRREAKRGFRAEGWWYRKEIKNFLNNKLMTSNVTVTTTAIVMHSERRSKRPSTRPALQIYRPPGKFIFSKFI